MRKDAGPVFFVPCGLEKLETYWKQSPEESYPVCILPFVRSCKRNKPLKFTGDITKAVDFQKATIFSLYISPASLITRKD